MGAYIQGKLYEMKKKNPRGFKDRDPVGQNVPRSSELIGSLFGVNEKTVRRSYEFAKAVDRVKEVKPLKLTLPCFAPSALSLQLFNPL